MSIFHIIYAALPKTFFKAPFGRLKCVVVNFEPFIPLGNVISVFFPIFSMLKSV